MCFKYDSSHYTVRNALTWRICGHHLAQVKKCSNWFGKTVYLGMFIALAFPGISQIGSLFELCVIKLCTRPYPKNALPPPQPVIPPLTSSSTAPAFPLSTEPKLRQPILRRKHEILKAEDESVIPSLMWPSNFETRLGLTEQERLFVDEQVKKLFRSLQGKNPTQSNFGKRRICYTDSTGKNVAYELPITIVPRQTEDGLRLFLLSKVVFKKGGEREIRWAYDLIHGEYWLKKRILNQPREKIIIHTLYQARKSRGHSSKPIWRDSIGKNKKAKPQLLDNMRDGTVSILLNTEPLSNFSLRCDLMRDLLKELSELHSIKFSSQIEGKTVEFKAFHRDLKIDNTLVLKPENARWQAELCDFGMAAATLDAWCISVGYTSPEFIEFLKEWAPLGLVAGFSSDDATDALKKFNLEFACKGDIWSLGLVLLSILVSRSERLDYEWGGNKLYSKIAPLNCLKERICPKVGDPYEEIGILNLTQATLDAELDLLLAETKQKHPQDVPAVEQMFTLVRSMLKIDPNQRLSIEELLKLADVS